MKYKGKTTCRILKDIRRQIAEANDIDLVIKECTYQGDCAGTCPRCEAEVAYLERELARRQALGKAACITGIATSALLGMPAAAQTQDTLPVQQTAPQQMNDEDEEFLGLVIESMPTFPGGQKALVEYLRENVHYPEEAQKEGKEGRVICQFFVNKDGTLVEFEVVRPSGDEHLDAEAIRLLKSMPNWEPGTQRGKPTRVKYTVPVNFRLEKDEETIHVKGQVLDENGLPLEGASVQINGTEQGTVTDYDGLFELDVCSKDSLLINYIGYKAIKRLSEPNMVVRFTEEDVDTEAEEIVLTGYGIWPASYKATECRSPHNSNKK